VKAPRRWWKQVASFLNRRRDETRLAAEIEQHLAHQTQENIRAGMSPDEARRQAVLKFGAVESVREAWRDQRSLPFFEMLVSDLRLALRRLRHAPVFTATIILTLALGIGATTSIFTLVHAVLLKSLAVEKPAELLRLGKNPRCCYFGGYTQPDEFSLVSYELYRHFRDNTKAFSELAAFQAGGIPLGVRRAGRGDSAQSYDGELVSGNYFRMFGVNAYAGRLLVPSDDRPHAAPVAVMSYRLWQERYGSDSSVIGSVFDLNQKPFTVVGIAPPSFFGDTLGNITPGFFLPLNTEPYLQSDADLYSNRLHWLELIGRMRPGSSPVAIEAEMRVDLKQWLRSHWGEMSANERAGFPKQTLYLRPGGAGITRMRRDYEHWLTILMTVTAVVLLITCANIANLMLVRSLEQRRQTSLSMALGARSSRLIRQTLTETILLALLGGAAGLAFAYLGASLILRFAFPVNLNSPLPISPAPSWPVLLFACAVSLLTGLAFGIAPAWLATRINPIEALRGASRSTLRTGSLPRRMLVAVQAALALILLSVAGLLTITLHQLEHQSLGFDPHRRIVANVNPRVAGYHGDQLAPLYRRIHESLASLPGVDSVAEATYSPLADNAWGAGIWIPGNPPLQPGFDNSAYWSRVSAGYFETLSMPILRGRGITEQDTANSRHVAVINEVLARKFFPREDPLGKHFRRDEDPSSPVYEIVGIANDARYLQFEIAQPIGPFFFLPDAQHDVSKSNGTEVSPGSHFLGDIVLLPRPGAHITDEQIRRAIASVEPNLPVMAIRTLEDQVSAVFRNQRLIARLTSFFGLLSLVLSCLGLYGVVAYNATQRTSEIGIRMALGADRAEIIALVLRSALVLIAIGLAIGLPLSLGASRFLGTQLYGTHPNNLLVTIFSLVALAFSATIAALIPALRASATSPLEALRTE
jgi:predicted permease